MLPIDEICHAFHLGSPITDPQPVTGGLLHKVWYLATTSGEYALKAIQSHSKLPTEQLQSPENAEQIAAYMQSEGIATVVALKYQNHYEYKIDEKIYLVMPWVRGEIRADNHISAAMAEIIGNRLASIHRIPPYPDNFISPQWQGRSKNEWRELIESNSAINFVIIDTIRSELDNLVRWSQRAESVADKFKTMSIFSHRDLDPKNVIWQDCKTPILLDWEYAGWIHPTLDLLIVALNWSEVLSGNINLEKFQALMRGYHASNPLKQSFTIDIVSGYMGYCLDWLAYNLTKLSEDFLAAKEVIQTVKAIQAVENAELMIIKLSETFLPDP